MSWVAAAIAGSAVAGYVGSQQAASQQAAAANNATQAQLQMFNQQQQAQKPWQQAGQTALNQLTAGTQEGGQFNRPFTTADLYSNLAPNYQWQLSQGQGALQNQMNAAGGLVSGNAFKGMQDYTQNYAANAYQQAFNNYQAQQTNIYNRLANIAGLGQTSTGQMGSMAAGMSPGIAGSMMGYGNAQAAGTMGGANAIGQGLTNYAMWNAMSQPQSYGGGTPYNWVTPGSEQANMISAQNAGF